MKLLHKLLSVSALAVAVSSCNLDEIPPTKLSPDVYFHSEVELQLYTNQFYELIPNPSDEFTWYYEQGEHIVTQELWREIKGERIIPSKASEVGWTWTKLRKINYYLQNSHRCEDANARTWYDGVALFFRAYFYYNMLTRFGEVPWYDQPLGSDQDELLAKPRDSREVIIRHIIEDLDNAYTLMSSVSTKRDVWEINCWTALALKSRACLFEGTFRRYHAGDPFNPESLPWEYLLEEGAAAARELMEKGGYSLYTDGAEPYRDVFATLEDRGCEFIWARRCSETVSVKHNANGWANTRAVGFTKAFVNLYLNADGTRYTDKPGYETDSYIDECVGRDPRMAQTVYCPGYIQKGDTKTYPTDLARNTTGYKYIKYVMDVKYNVWGASMTPLPIFRLGEVYLNYAECLAELGTLTQADLDMSINELRKRAGMPDLKLADANSNPDPYLLSDKTGYPHVTRSANTGVILEIRRERMIEMALEGVHYNDILRWREGSVYNRQYQGQYFPGEGKYDLTGDGKANVALYTGKKPGGLGLTFLKMGEEIFLTEGDHGYMTVYNEPAMQRNWHEDRDYLYAIPITERLLSGGALSQNPGWNDGLNF